MIEKKESIPSIIFFSWLYALIAGTIGSVLIVAITLSVHLIISFSLTETKLFFLGNYDLLLFLSVLLVFFDFCDRVVKGLRDKRIVSFIRDKNDRS